VCGYDIVRQAAQVRRVIGYVPQALSADGELTGYENLKVFAQLYDIPWRMQETRIQEGLDFMGLGEAANRLVSTYSGGMIRRLGVCQSMLHRPKVLFLDEPTVGLDPVARDAVWEHITQLRASFGTTIILTTHYMDEAEKLCGRVAIMHRGKIATVGTLDELRTIEGDQKATLDELFADFTRDDVESEDAYAATAGLRSAAQRLG
jgi:ABC-2 type transport system ATP-binding protein